MENETIDNPQGNPSYIGWLAGFIDGEGSIEMARRCGKYKNGGNCRYSPRIRISNTNYDVLEKIHEMLDALGISHHISHRNPLNPNWSKSWLIEIVGISRIAKLCNLLIPTSIVKKKELKTMLEFCRSRQVAPYMENTTQRPYSDKEKNIIHFFKQYRRGPHRLNAWQEEANKFLMV